MEQNQIYTLLAVVLVSLVSLIGIFTIVRAGWFRKILTFLVSFAAGALLGDVFIHLLPEAVSEGQFNFASSLTVLATISAFFIIEKYLHWHHHHDEEHLNLHPHPLVVTNLIADGLHNFIDGLIIAAAFLADPALGVATTIAVILHEIPQEIGDFGVLIYGGLTPKKALGFNFLSALAAILGAVIGLRLGESESLLSVLLALGIGSFIYIALADLVPQLHKEKQNSLSQLLSFGLGIGAMFLLLYFG